MLVNVNAPVETQVWFIAADITWFCLNVTILELLEKLIVEVQSISLQ